MMDKHKEKLKKYFTELRPGDWVPRTTFVVLLRGRAVVGWDGADHILVEDVWDSHDSVHLDGVPKTDIEVYRIIRSW